MTKFMSKDFLLENNIAKTLFNEYAKDIEIFDYHCHLSPREIYEDKHFEDLTELWLSGDHYKWRIMRANGIEEKYITGDAPSYEKFYKFASCLQYAIGNPIYHWSHLELQRYFNIYENLNINTAESIWEEANKIITKKDFSVRTLIKKSNVNTLCTTDDPIDSLEYHIKLKFDKNFDVDVLPTWRPDYILQIENDGFLEYINKLEKITEIKIIDFKTFCDAISLRLDYFDDVGCVSSDHGFEYLPYKEYTIIEIEKIFKLALNRSKLEKEDIDKYKTAMMGYLASEYKKKNWVMELHIGAIRNNNTRKMNQLGINTGFDSIDDSLMASKLSKFLDSLEVLSNLPKTIIFTMNPKDNWVIATMAGNFQSSDAISKIQFGTAWWMQDHRDGMIEHMKCFANSGLLGRFIGMLTDSRSYISYTRHEYFRRILCNMIGKWVENGEYPEDYNVLGNIIEDICYNNAKRYFMEN